jgi:hypothetical protein
VTVATNGQEFTWDDPIHVTVTVKNVSGGPLVVPKIGVLEEALYFDVDVVHESGVPVFFQDPETSGIVPRETQVLEDGEQIAFPITLNSFGAGPLGYPKPGELRILSGHFNVIGKFVVNAANRPTGGNPVFEGEVTSAQPLRVVIRGPRGVAAPAVSWFGVVSSVGVLLLVAAGALRRRWE